MTNNNQNINNTQEMLNNELLEEAFKKGRDIHKIEKLLDAGANVNIINDYSTTLLFESIVKNDTELALMLIKKGAEVGKDGGPSIRPPIIEAVAQGNIPITEALISAGANVNDIESEGFTALALAYEPCVGNQLVQAGRVIIRSILIDAGADVNVRCRGDETPLILRAIEFGLTDGALKMLDAGAYIDTEDSLQQTALMYAANHGNVDVVQKLIDQGADLSKKSYFGDTALAYTLDSAIIMSPDLVDDIIVGEGGISSTNNKVNNEKIESKEIAIMLAAAGADITFLGDENKAFLSKYCQASKKELSLSANEKDKSSQDTKLENQHRTNREELRKKPLSEDNQKSTEWRDRFNQSNVDRGPIR